MNIAQVCKGQSGTREEGKTLVFPLVLYPVGLQPAGCGVTQHLRTSAEPVWVLLPWDELLPRTGGCPKPTLSKLSHIPELQPCPKTTLGCSAPCCYLSGELCLSVSGVASSPRSSSTRGWYSRTILRKPCRNGIVLCPCTPSTGLLSPFKTSKAFSRRKHSLPVPYIRQPSPAQGSPPTHQFGVPKLSPAGRAALCGYLGTGWEHSRHSPGWAQSPGAQGALSALKLQSPAWILWERGLRDPAVQQPQEAPQCPRRRKGQEPPDPAGGATRPCLEIATQKICKTYISISLSFLS